MIFESESKKNKMKNGENYPTIGNTDALKPPIFAMISKTEKYFKMYRLSTKFILS